MAPIPNVNQPPGGGDYSIPSMASFNRPANATPYAAGDIVGTVASGVLKFPGAGVGGQILRATVAAANIATASFDLFVFDAEPAVGVDNTALNVPDEDLPKLVAVYKFGDADKTITGTDGSFYVTTLASSVGPAHCYASGGELYGVLVSRSVYTPESGTEITVRLNLEIDHR